MPHRTLTGIQPSGSLHLGNYFGAMRPAVEAQGGSECFYFIANYHSMTSLFDAAERRSRTLDVALDWLACGLDPQRSVLFRQSDLPDVCELYWLLGTVTPKALLELATSYKDKVARGVTPHFGLFAYPVLMAADILILDATHVPVGKDQKQHLEMARDIASKFNQTYGETFTLPEPVIREQVAVVPGLDGQKMSKSYGNAIEIFGDERTLRKKVMSIVMDSRSPAEPKPDADRNVAIQLLQLVAPGEVAIDCEARLRSGGFGYGELKKTLFEQLWASLEEPRKRRAELAANLDYVEEVLREGAEKARALARGVVERARRASGLAR